MVNDRGLEFAVSERHDAAGESTAGAREPGKGSKPASDRSIDQIERAVVDDEDGQRESCEDRRCQLTLTESITPFL
jgi:hypothetical protein